MNHRREFLKKTLASAGFAYLAWQQRLFAMGGNSDKPQKQPAKIDLTQKRMLGKTGLMVYPIAFGGIVVKGETPEKSAMEVENAINGGVNYFDVAPSYGDAEEKLGGALERYRKDVYLACKTLKRDREGAKKELEDSLEKLRTDHFDVYQLHAITDVEKDVKPVFAKGGAMETILKAKEEGVIRNIGFSAHSPQAALTAMEMFDFDTIMYPITFTTHYTSGFEDEVLKRAKEKNMGVIAIKTFAKQKWQDKEDRKKYPKCWYQPIDEPELAKMSISWTLEQGAAITIPPGQNELFHLAMDVFPKIKELSSEDIEKLKNISQQIEPIFRA